MCCRNVNRTLEIRLYLIEFCKKLIRDLNGDSMQNILSNFLPPRHLMKHLLKHPFLRLALRHPLRHPLKHLLERHLKPHLPPAPSRLPLGPPLRHPLHHLLINWVELALIVMYLKYMRIQLHCEVIYDAL